MFSAPAVDVADGLVFGTFGQPVHGAGERRGLQRGRAERLLQRVVRAARRFWKSIVAFDLDTGAPVWSYRVLATRRGSARAARSRRTVDLVRRRRPTARSGTSAARARTSSGSGRGREVVGFGGKSGVYYRLRREDRRVGLEHAGRPGRRPGRLRVGHGLRRQPHLRLAHEPAPHPVPPDRERRAHEHDRHRRLVDGARPGDREDPLADRRPADRDPARLRRARSASGTSAR